MLQCVDDCEMLMFSITLPLCYMYHTVAMVAANGQVVFTVLYEFEVCLTVLGDDLSLPWRLLKLEILVGNRQTGETVIV